MSSTEKTLNITFLMAGIGFMVADYFVTNRVLQIGFMVASLLFFLFAIIIALFSFNPEKYRVSRGSYHG